MNKRSNASATQKRFATSVSLPAKRKQNCSPNRICSFFPHFIMAKALAWSFLKRWLSAYRSSPPTGVQFPIFFPRTIQDSSISRLQIKSRPPFFNSPCATIRMNSVAPFSRNTPSKNSSANLPTRSDQSSPILKSTILYPKNLQLLRGRRRLERHHVASLRIQQRLCQRRLPRNIIPFQINFVNAHNFERLHVPARILHRHRRAEPHLIPHGRFNHRDRTKNLSQPRNTLIEIRSLRAILCRRRARPLCLQLRQFAVQRLHSLARDVILNPWRQGGQRPQRRALRKIILPHKSPAHIEVSQYPSERSKCNLAKRVFETAFSILAVLCANQRSACAGLNRNFIRYP